MTKDASELRNLKMELIRVTSVLSLTLGKMNILRRNSSHNGVLRIHTKLLKIHPFKNDRFSTYAVT